MGLDKDSFESDLNDVFANNSPSTDAEFQALKAGTAFAAGLVNAFVSFTKTAELKVPVEGGSVSGGVYKGSGKGSIVGVSQQSTLTLAMTASMGAMFLTMTDLYATQVKAIVAGCVSSAVVSMKTSGTTTIPGTPPTDVPVTDLPGTGSLVATNIDDEFNSFSDKLSDLNLRTVQDEEGGSRSETIEEQTQRLGEPAADYLVHAHVYFLNNVLTACTVSSSYPSGPASGSDGTVS